MDRWLSLLYGVICYLIFLGSFLYAIPFVGDFLVPRTIDSGPAASLGNALLVNVLLLGLFAIQHSVMARNEFKRHWVKIVPEHLERSTYVLFTSLILILLYWQWRPIPGDVWHVTGAFAGILWGLFALGWILVLVATFMIDHFELFGLRQPWCYFQNEPFEPPSFQTPGLYKYVRHPIMLGFIIAFWATPRMTMGHLLFAVMTTGYIFVGVTLEERDLLNRFGAKYREYRQRVPMLLPWISDSSGEESETFEEEAPR